MIQGKLELTLLAHTLRELEMGGQKWAHQFANAFLIGGPLAEPGVYLAQTCGDAELTPQQLLTSSKWRVKTRRAAVTDPHEGALWGDALNQVDECWLDGLFPFDVVGKLVTGLGPQMVNRSFRFGAQ